MPIRFAIPFLCAINGVLAGGVFGDLPSAPKASVEQRFQDDLADGKLDSFSLFEAVLLAGGVCTQDQLTEFQRQFAELCQTARNELMATGDLRSQADRLVQRLHQDVLTGEYRAECSALDQSLESGDYNCVTATILFCCVADRVGLPVQAVAARGHVLCAVQATPRLFVEPTCRQWRACDAADCPETTAKYVREARGLSSEQLLGKVYFNLGVARLQQNGFETAAELFRLAERLDPLDPAARANWLATQNNWALALCDRGQFAEASKLVRVGLATDPTYAPLLANDLHIHQKWIKRLCEERQLAEALTVLEAGFRRRPEADLFARGRLAVLELQRQAIAADVESSPRDSE